MKLQEEIMTRSVTAMDDTGWLAGLSGIKGLRWIFAILSQHLGTAQQAAYLKFRLRAPAPMVPYYLLIALSLAPFVNSVWLIENRMARSIEKRSRGRYCGAALDDVLRFVCKGSYNSLFENKRSPGLELEHDADPVDSENPGFPFSPKQSALSLLATDRTSRRRRQIVNECCIMKSCSMKELSGYCSQR